MCRLLAYKGNERYLAEWLIRPSNSLIRQSYGAKEMAEPINGDGFGIGWYSEGPDPTPCLFTSLAPAWSDPNLRRLAIRIRSSCFYAHVRAATAGLAVNEQNCHPFRFGRFMWMHNGRIGRFNRVKRRLRASLREDLYQRILGTSDSEHAFYVFLNHLGGARAEVGRALECCPEALHAYRTQFYELMHDTSDEEIDGMTMVDRLVEHLGIFPPETLVEAMRRTLATLSQWAVEVDSDEVSFHNFAVTDGRVILVTRYADAEHEEPPSLYCTSDLRLADADGRLSPAVVVSSEPLNDLHGRWKKIPRNHMLLVREDCSIELLPVEISRESAVSIDSAPPALPMA